MITCRNCGMCCSMKVEVDLGFQPPANYLTPQAWQAMVAPKFPLCAVRCPSCSLVQLTEVVPGLFPKDYVYRQGQSSTWIAHLSDFVNAHQPQRDFPTHLDVGANDGTLVHMMIDEGWDSWGVDPAPQGPNVIPGSMGYAFALTTGALFSKFELITAFNVLAHVPDLDDFLGGVRMLLAPEGQFVVEVPDWEKSTWDQIYHEHLSYFTESTLANCLVRRGFHVDDMIAVPTHGGSLRAVCRHA